MKDKLFGNINLNTIRNNDDFKEDSVREVIILPILKELGYREGNIIRSKQLQHAFLKTGSKKRPINLIPDYLLRVEDRYAWVLDAKSPKQKITYGDNVEQVYSYAVHQEIRSNYFSLCNGLEFTVFKTNDTDSPILYFEIDQIDEYWDDLNKLLSPNSFHTGKEIKYTSVINNNLNSSSISYENRPLLEEIKVKKQAAKRHFGVHGYFTKQAWNVVAEYIKNFSNKNDIILDPFGGSGVTAIEAMMNDRKAINIDLNPMAVFMVDSLISPVNINRLREIFDDIKNEYLKKEPKSDEEIKFSLKKYKGPKVIKLPKGSDVETADLLFSDEQKAKLGLLKQIILKYKYNDQNLKKAFLLAFSSTVNKYNLTFHYTKSEGGGDSAPFRYYRYRIAPDPGSNQLMNIYEKKLKNIIEAKKELNLKINDKTIDRIKVLKGTATDLHSIPTESVDYIYTDPPYGKKIPYLDLSAMWNAWLDLDVTDEDYKMEAIEGGEKNKSKSEYNELIALSIKEMYRVLKFDRWMSFVFAHKDPEFWHLIIDTAESCGFEYKGAVAQKNGQTSFKKRQNPFTVLSGQLIINFRKVKNPKTILKANLGMDIGDIIINTIEALIAKNNGATLEQINDELIIRGLEMGFLDLLKKEYTDLTPLLIENYDYDDKSQKFKLKKDTKFRTHIDVRLRIKYFLTSYLRRKEREGVSPHFDDIILYIMPLLKNGVTPENQTILSVLSDIAERVNEDCWTLKKDLLELFV